jgi:Porin subfamily
MKMVKSLLLGSAAGLVAVTAGQAADLPVKAKPVEYVKVCSLYGAGFYYMPGTDLCLKIGGWVRAEAGWGMNGTFSTNPMSANLQQRGTNNMVFRGRGYITADAREQTAYGTARGYIAVGVSTNDLGLNTAGNQFSANRAFVQFAGFTGGISQSFYDYFSSAAAGYQVGGTGGSDTGDPGWTVFGYTAQLGNGLSATLAMETRRTTQIVDANSVFAGNNGSAGFSNGAGTIVPGSYFNTLTGVDGSTAGNILVSGGAALFPGNGAYGGQQLGDIVGNLRVDQAWGGAQIMGALHELNPTYYGTTSSGNPSILSGQSPGDSWGWAAGAGLRLNFPMIGEGDYFQAQGNYTEGAARYALFTPNFNWGEVNGAKEAYGVLSDCVYGGFAAGSGGLPSATTSCHKTTAYGVNASYEHHWGFAPAWQTSVYGTWYAVRYDAASNAMLCAASGSPANGVGVGSGAAAIAGCNNNWSTWAVGTRTQWNVSKTFYMGVDVLYDDLKSATTADGLPHGYAFGSAQTVESNGHTWSVRFRAHKDFLP